MTGVAEKRPSDVCCAGRESALRSNNVQSSDLAWQSTENWNYPYRSLRRKDIEIEVDKKIVKEETAPVSKNFIEQIIEKDLAEGKYDTICTRFPPKPNGYLHIGHAKAILLNYGLAQKYHGKFNMRFADTNPTKEKEEFVESIKADIKWQDADWEDRLYFASNYSAKK